jgi:putative membrane protein
MQTSQSRATRRSVWGYLGVSLRGFFMGAADVVPGVSGGTIALLVGIYDELLEAIHAVDGKLVKQLLSFRWREALGAFPWKFLLALAAGIGLAVFTLARALHGLLESHPERVWAFFFGLVAASAVVVVRRVRRFTPVGLAGMALAAVGAYLLLGLAPAQTPGEPWFLFVSGALAVCAMILPGVSGAFVLVLLGKYESILRAVLHLDFATLGLVALGGMTGLLSFARLLRWLLRRFHDVTVACLAGFMLGSLRKIWPWKEAPAGLEVDAAELMVNRLPAEWSPEAGLTLALMAAGFLLVAGIELAGAHLRTRG